MEHLAILKPEYFNKIRNETKTIESRWSVYNRNPYKNRKDIKVGEKLYFKPTGGLVSLKAKIAKTFFEADLTEKRIKELIKQYGKRIGIDLDYYTKEIRGKGKKYCSLIFIKNVVSITPKKFKTKKGSRLAWFTKPKIF